MYPNPDFPTPEIKPGERCYIRDLPVPPEVQPHVEAHCQGFRFRKARHRQKVEDDLKTQYYFGGLDIAYLVTPRGRAVVVAGFGGTEEYSRAMAALSPRDRRAAVRYTPPPWDIDEGYLGTALDDL